MGETLPVLLIVVGSLVGSMALTVFNLYVCVLIDAWYNQTPLGYNSLELEHILWDFGNLDYPLFFGGTVTGLLTAVTTVRMLFYVIVFIPMGIFKSMGARYRLDSDNVARILNKLLIRKR